MNSFTDVQSALPGSQRQTQPQVNSGSRTVTHTEASAAVSRWALYRHRRTSRRALLELTDDELRDIGLDYSQARIEAGKPFWRA
ncbi:DUF1127 domain-containing protein [Pseudomonas sp. 21LCFQ010]|uniref:DUF1127 domain-containing protein n=1 Tax=Pseudomonas sp. 21LCFQ010 TaxID=2957506 RepID=UPI00209847CF|nr:DUF1127 domain-containing protein [Pseudomonas sp. 21LCFQ010]MCO8162471.1 DUF1127 domain-containing protein [Pseudomonas sp. 21LCFQ010]